MLENEELFRICAWCNREIGPDNNATGPVIPKEMQVNGKITHGLCRECYEQQMRELKGIK